MNETPEQGVRVKQQEKERKELERQLEQQYDRSNQIDQSLIDSVDLYRNGGYLQEMFLGGLWKRLRKLVLPFGKVLPRLHLTRLFQL